jgi:hypothetical protein
MISSSIVFKYKDRNPYQNRSYQRRDFAAKALLENTISSIAANTKSKNARFKENK